MKSLVRAAAAASLALLSSVATTTRADTPPPQGVLGLSANASIEVVKDLLAVTLSINREGSDANAVQAQLKQALDTALAEAKKAARPGQVDVQTGNFSLYPRYASATSSGRGAITGWQGSAELIVEGRDMAAIGQLTGRITTMTIARVAYRLSRDASQRVETDIAADAVAAFRAKATSYAKLFGYGGYAVREVTITTSDLQPGPPMPMMARSQGMTGSAEALSVEPGKATVTATVNGTIQMK
jgi:predicted secreted protein